MHSHEPQGLEATRQLSRHELDRLVPGARRTFGYIGPYQLVEVLGRGGSSIVFRARKSQGSDLALKVLSAVPGTKPIELTRFQREAQVGAHLRQHPNIVTIYDTGRDGSSYYIAMELVPGGRTLKDVVEAQGGLPRNDALTMAVAIADALAYAHRNGFVHRDIKPGNVLIGSAGQPLLTDFGLVHADDSSITAHGEVLGTPVFMAPEELSAKTGSATPQVDIYSYGILLYYLLTARLPFAIDPKMPLNQILSIVLTAPPTTPAAYGKQVGADLEAVLARLLQKDPSHRYPTMAAVLDDLHACREGQRPAALGPAPAPAPAPPTGGRRVTRRTLALLAAAAAGLLLLGVALLLLARPWHRPRAPAVPTNLELLMAGESLGGDPGAAVPPAPDSPAASRWQQARERFAAGDLAGARQAVNETIAQAHRRHERDLEYRARAALARLDLAANQFTSAREEFLSLAAIHPRYSPSWELCLFEAGVAAWLANERHQAEETWSLIAPDFAGRPLANPRVKSYLQYVTEFMLRAPDEPRLRAEMAKVPNAFQALALWAMAQRQPVPERRTALLRAAAAKGKHHFVWLKEE